MSIIRGDRQNCARAILLFYVPVFLASANAQSNAAATEQDGMEISRVLLHNRALDKDELYSWPGAASFAAGDLSELIGQGFLGSGTFHTFSRNLFASNAPIVSRAADDFVDGRRAIRYTYRMPSLSPTWMINWKGARGLAGEAGEFWVDADSRTLLRIRVNAQDLPPNLPLSNLVVTIDFQETSNRGRRTVLLPRAAELHAVEWNGTAHRDLATFTQCHVFEAQSGLVAQTRLTDAMRRYESFREELPGGLSLSVALAENLHLPSLHVGDPVRARLTNPLKISRDTVIPNGAELLGRVRTLQALEDLGDTTEVGIAFDGIQWSGRTGVFTADLVTLGQAPGISTLLTRSATSGKGLSVLTENTRPADMPGVATFFVTGTHTVPAGLRMTWRTHPPHHRTPLP